MTISIRAALAVLPSGQRFPELTWQEVATYLRTNCDREEDRQREARHILRDRMYRDGGCDHICKILDDVFEDQRIAKRRKKWVPYARFANPLKRTVVELSTVYQRIATRSVKGDADQATYRQLLADVRMDERALHFNRMLTLHRTILLGFRVKVHADGTRTPIAYCVTPSQFRPVLDPSDDSHVIGWLVRTGYRPAGALGLTAAASNAPAWVLWTDHERVLLRSDMTPIDDTVIEHKFGLAPLVPVSMTPTDAGFWNGEDGEDLVAARVAVWVTNVLMLKETKSATKAPVVTGDVSTASRDQMIDNENLFELPEGAALSQIDASMDLEMYQTVSDHISDASGQNYGMTPSQVRNQGVQSADARDLMRIPLNELRDQQKLPWRDAERAYAKVMSVVCAVEIEDRKFSLEGWKIDFAEGATPLGQIDTLNLYERMRKLGLDNPIDFLKRLNPDLTDEDCTEILKRNTEINLLVQMIMRPMMAASGADQGGDPAKAAAVAAAQAQADANKLEADTGVVDTTDAADMAAASA